MWGRDQMAERERRLKEQRDFIKAKKAKEREDAIKLHQEMISKTNKDKMRFTSTKFKESTDEKKARLNRAFDALRNMKGDLKGAASSKVTSAQIIQNINKKGPVNLEDK